jgi:hypothetical protein
MAAAFSRSSPREYFGGELPSRRNQITIPTTHGLVRKYDDLIDWINQSGRDWQGKRFNKLRFWNSLMLGIAEAFDDGGVDHEAIDEKGLLGYLIDNGAHLMAVATTAGTSERVGLDPWEEESAADLSKGKEDVDRQPPKPDMPRLRIPKNFLLDDEAGDATGRAKGK